LTYSRVFPQGESEADLLALSTPRPALPFTTPTNARGEHILLWTTFTSDQIDIDARDPEARRYLTGILSRLHSAKVRAIRLDALHVRSRDERRLASGDAARNVDACQINCTFYDALGRRDAEYLVARAIQCFVPGIPQIYYVGLLAGTNDLDLLRRTREGRDIN